jgi:hypothetical protein
VAERLKAPVLKTGMVLVAIVGSNPTPSAMPRLRDDFLKIEGKYK